MMRFQRRCNHHIHSNSPQTASRKSKRYIDQQGQADPIHARTPHIYIDRNVEVHPGCTG